MQICISTWIKEAFIFLFTNEDAYFSDPIFKKGKINVTLVAM